MAAAHDFNGSGNRSPLLALGMNYAVYVAESGQGPLAGTALKLKDAFGLTAHAGFDVAVGERSAIRLHVRWIDMGPKVERHGTDAGSLNIDPLMFGVGYVRYF